MLFDSHAHLQIQPLSDQLELVLDQAAQVDVDRILIPSVGRSDWVQVQKVCSVSHPIRRYFALGLHPCFLGQHADLQDLEYLDQALRDLSPAAIGECGLDLFIDDPQFERQLSLFDAQIELSIKHQLPLVIHARRAVDQVIARLRRFRPEAGGVVHAFSGSVQQAQQLWELGFSIGLGGALTYARAQRLHRVAKTLPLEAILLETDAPDMPLSGFQGQPNAPAQVSRVAECLAELRSTERETIAEQTWNNAMRLFDPETLA